METSRSTQMTIVLAVVGSVSVGLIMSSVVWAFGFPAVKIWQCGIATSVFFMGFLMFHLWLNSFPRRAHISYLSASVVLVVLSLVLTFVLFAAK